MSKHIITGGFIFMRKIIVSLLSIFLVFVLAIPALAHDGWSQTASPIIAPNETSYVELLYGNHSNHHASYRIEGRWNMDNSKVYVTTPLGQKADISSTVFYTGEPTGSESRVGINNYYVASFSASNLGAYIISVEGDSIFGTSRTFRSAKSFVAVSDIPVLQRVKHLKGFQKQVSPDRAELIPHFNPAAITPNQTISLKLLLKGEPLADTEISLIRRSNSAAQTMTTDDKGIVSFITGPADYYLVRAKPSTDEAVEGKYAATNYETTMTFTVQSGNHTLPATHVQVLPSIHLNGQLVEVPELELVHGSLQVNAAFIKEHISSAYEGSGKVGLRAAVESLGASVEYFAPIAGLPAAVYIHKLN
jgi:uncharacterized GH25 family protein